MQATKNARMPKKEARTELERLTEALAAPFDPKEVRYKPAVVSGNRALALAYVDARVIQDRLDEVLGPAGWQDDYECLPDGSVVCRLKLQLGDQWITKVDVGGPSEQPDGGDRMKAAFSDALKRAAVKFGVGRYLYRLPSQWVDYDPQRRQFVQAPTLPRWALPARQSEATEAEPEETPTLPAKPSPLTRHALPADGAELQRRLCDYDARLAAQGLCAPGELIKHVVQSGVQAGYDPDLTRWSGPAMQLAAEQTRAFEAQARKRLAGRKSVA